MKYLIIACIFTLLLSITQAANSTPDGRRGVARIMDMSGFSGYNDENSSNSTSSDTLDKRDRGTWYSGQDLKYAACYSGRNNLPRVDAKVGDMIGAMAMHDFEQCYKCMQITNNRQRNKRIIVQIIDKCAACKVGRAIDLTPGAFKKLAPNGNLNIGVLDISFRPVKCPRRGIFDVLAKLL